VTHSIATIVRACKTAGTIKNDTQLDQHGGSIWQRNDWDHAIRNESEIITIPEYRITNRARGPGDRLAPRSLQEA
jgi:hypothetical protein